MPIAGHRKQMKHTICH